MQLGLDLLFSFNHSFTSLVISFNHFFHVCRDFVMSVVIL
jgi:hypothetical protein